MKVLFDANVYVSEALVGELAEQIIDRPLIEGRPCALQSLDG